MEGFTVSDCVAYQQTRAFRRFFLIRLGLIAIVVWLLSWPTHVLPHTVLWGVFATASLAIGLTSSPLTRATNRDKTSTPRR